MLLSMWTSSTSGNSLSPFIRDLISLLVWTDEVSESGQPPKSDSQFFDDEAHFESDDNEAPLYRRGKKSKPSRSVLGELRHLRSQRQDVAMLR